MEADALLKQVSVPGDRSVLQDNIDDLAGLREAVEELSDVPLLASIDYWTGRLQYILGDFEAAILEATQSFEQAETASGGARVAADAGNLLARIHTIQGAPRLAIRFAKRNASQMAALGNVMEQAAITSVLAFSYGINGQFEDAAAAADEGVRLAADLDHLPTRAAAFFYRGFVLGWWGKVDEAEPDFADALELSHSANDLFRVYVAHGWRGQALLQANELAAAETDLDRCLALAKQLGTNFHLGAFQAFRAALDLRRGVPAVETSAEAVAISDGQPWGQSIALRIHGEALIETDPHAAGVALQQALMLQRGRECWYDAAWTNLALGNLHRHLGDEPASLAALAEARRAFADMGVGSGIAALKEVGIA